MTCDECGDLMLEVVRRRAAPFVEHAVREHAAACSACEEGLTRQLALTLGLRTLAGADSAVEDGAALEGRLLEAFATRHAPQSVTRRRVASARWLARAAAVVLSAAAATWWLARPHVPDPPSSVARGEPTSPPPVAPPLPREEPGGGGASHPRPKRALPLVPRQTVSNRPPRVEPAGFTAIPAAAGLPDFESGEIVRLGIDVTALPNYGIEIPPGAQAAVQADLLIGQDGQARAIRLVTSGFDDARPRR